MPGKPIATLGSMTVCPMCSGYIPHVGGPVAGPGAPNVLVNNKPAAVMGDMCTCIGPPATIVQGEPTVLINGTPVATMGSMTSHGGSVTQGEPTVLVGSATPGATAIMPVQRIPFPTITPLNRVKASVVGSGSDLRTAEQNMEQIKRDADIKDVEPKIYGVKWLKEEQTTSESKERKTINVQASVLNIDDGETVTFSIKRTQEDGTVIEKELSGTVEAGKATASWEIEEENTNQ